MNEPGPIVYVGLTFGFAAGVVTGVVGAVTATGLSLAGVGERTCQVVGGVLSAACVGGLLWLFLDNDGEMFDAVEESRDWLLYVVGPAVVALLIGAWRAAPIMRTGKARQEARAAAVG